MGERLNGIQEVEGSTPFGSTLPFAGLGDLRAASEADRSRFVADDHDLSRRLLLVDGPARAIRCADAIRQASRALGLDVRAGLHTGECEMRGDDFRGIAVHIGARVADQAAGGEILVSSTVRPRRWLGNRVRAAGHPTLNQVSGRCSPRGVSRPRAVCGPAIRRLQHGRNAAPPALSTAGRGGVRVRDARCTARGGPRGEAEVK